MSPQSRFQPREGRERRARVVTIIAATAGLAVVTAACGASPSSTDPGSSANAAGATSTASALAWVQCVRSHGVPAFPGLNSSGYIPKIISGQQVGVSDAQFNAAQTACQSLWPYHAPTQAQQRQTLTADLKFAQCMRSHGLPNFPDPTSDPESGKVEFILSVSKLGGGPRSPQILAKARACQQATLPPGSPLPIATEVP